MLSELSKNEHITATTETKDKCEEIIELLEKVLVPEELTPDSEEYDEKYNDYVMLCVYLSNEENQDRKSTTWMMLKNFANNKKVPLTIEPSLPRRSVHYL